MSTVQRSQPSLQSYSMSPSVLLTAHLYRTWCADKQINNEYDGRSINKLQNGVMLLIFRLPKCTFLGDLILSTSYEFYYDDITVTSFINIRYGNVVVEIIPQGTAFCYSFAVL